MQQAQATPICRETILLVENNSALRQRILQQLRTQGYQLDTARDGDTALSKLRTSEPDIILLGAELPDMSAGELYHRLHTDDNEFQRSVIFMLDPDTASDSTLECLARCGADFISSPFQNSELLLRLRMSLERQQSRRLLQQEQNTLEALRESEKRFRSFAEHSLDTMMRFDRQYRHLYVNPIVEQQTGIPPEAFIGKTHTELGFPDKLVTQWEHALETTFSSQKPFRTEFELPDHTWIDWLLIPEFSPVGEVDTVITLARDVTEFKRVEKASQEAREVAETANQTKTEFLARMSHEIRTPMNAVIGLSHLALQTDIAGKPKDYLNKIHTSAYSLLGIINDILDFSRIEAGKMELETIPFELQEVLENVSNVASVKAAEKGLSLSFAVEQDIPPVLQGDPLRLGQILLNLINNAVKFTDSGQIHVGVELSTLNTEEAQLIFSVKDSGIGISDAQMLILFQPFSQADTSMTRQYGGSGLGLTICKRLVDMMGGNIQVESTPKEGSVFRVFLRFIYQQGEYGTMPHSFSSAFHDMRTLLVDDSKTSRKALSLMLKSFSLNVDVADSGQAALDALESAARREKPYTLILMDWKMPEMDGIELAERIKQHPGLPRKPIVIMVSSYGRQEVIQRAEKAGADGFLIKPVTPSVLFETINEAFNLIVPPVSPKVHQEIFQRKRQAFIQHNAKILVVEDNLINQQVARELLESVGIQVETVNNGREALEALHFDTHDAHMYDAVLMDLQMPELDGYSATREIRKKEAQTSGTRSRLPIIAMTAHAMQGEREKCLDAGMDDYVKKPIIPAGLFAVLEKWLPQQTFSATSADTASKAVAASVSETQLSQKLPGFNTQEALERVGGKWDVYMRLLQKFSANHANDIDSIREALRNGDSELAHRLIHTLKGMAGNLSNYELYAAALEAEKAILERTHELPASSLDAVETALRQAVQHIELLNAGHRRDMADIKAVDDTEPVGTDTLHSLLEHLRLLLQDDDMDAMDCLSALKKRVTSPDYQVELQELKTLIGNYEFQDALETLQSLSLRLDVQ